jgi:hypothetical protein
MRSLRYNLQKERFFVCFVLLMTKSLRAFHIVHNVTQGPTQICNLSFLQTPMQPISEQIYYVG